MQMKMVAADFKPTLQYFLRHMTQIEIEQPNLQNSRTNTMWDEAVVQNSVKTNKFNELRQSIR